MPTSTKKILDTLEWAKKFNFNRRSALGNFLEPAITNANIVLQTIVGPPFTWRWNRITTGFMAQDGQQDYYLFNWAASTAVQINWQTLDTNGNVQVATGMGTTGLTLPTWNPTTGATTTDGTVVWNNLGPLGVSTFSTTYNFGWIEKASLQSMVTASPLVTKWYELTTKLVLGLDNVEDRPQFISAQEDDGSGNITFRLMPMPDTAYPVALTLQQKPPVIDSIEATWNPIPDEYSRLYDWGFLALFYLFADDPRFGSANQKFVTQLLSVNEGLTETQRNIFLGNWQYVTG
jgi:hypothetical protein